MCRTLGLVLGIQSGMQQPPGSEGVLPDGGNKRRQARCRWGASVGSPTSPFAGVWAGEVSFGLSPEGRAELASIEGGSTFQAVARQVQRAGEGSRGIFGASLSFSKNVELMQNAD